MSLGYSIPGAKKGHQEVCSDRPTTNSAKGVLGLVIHKL